MNSQYFSGHYMIRDHTPVNDANRNNQNDHIDLNEQLVRNKDETFFLRVNSNVMQGAGINKGDVIIVDRAAKPDNGKVVIAMVGEDLLIRKLEITSNKKRLVAPGSGLADLEFNDSNCFNWGVVTYVIHAL